MSKSVRLLDLLQLLRRHRRPVSGAKLAAELGVSLRTLYRDIDSLRASGAPIEGEAGIGYVLRPGFTLPPLMLAEEEIEALVLGTRWVARRTDESLGRAAENALAKIAAVLPAELGERVEASTLLVGPSRVATADPATLVAIRTAISAERRLAIRYGDEKANTTDRIIWPFALAFFDDARIVAAWCELRQDFRHFRVDRIAGLDMLAGRYPRRRRTLLSEWRAAQGIPPPR